MMEKIYVISDRAFDNIYALDSLVVIDNIDLVYHELSSATDFTFFKVLRQNNTLKRLSNGSMGYIEPIVQDLLRESIEVTVTDNSSHGIDYKLFKSEYSTVALVLTKVRLTLNAPMFFNLTECFVKDNLQDLERIKDFMITNNIEFLKTMFNESSDIYEEDKSSNYLYTARVNKNTSQLEIVFSDYLGLNRVRFALNLETLAVIERFSKI